MGREDEIQMGRTGESVFTMAEAALRRIAKAWALKQLTKGLS